MLVVLHTCSSSGVIICTFVQTLILILLSELSVLWEVIYRLTVPSGKEVNACCVAYLEALSL
jgi:hypothetical protein